MSKVYPLVPLSEVLKRQKDEINIQEIDTYTRITIRMNGQGIVMRDRVPGSKIGTKKQFITKAGQLVLSKIDARNGAFGILPDEYEGAIITGNFWAFDVKSEVLDIRYFDYLTKTPLFIDFCIGASDGTTNRRYLQESKFLAMEIPLPPLEEQRRIVARVEVLAGKIEEARSLRRQGLEETDALVVSSARKLLAAVIAKVTELNCWLDRERNGIQTGPFGAQLGANDFLENGVPVLTIGNIQYGGIQLNGLKYVSEEKAQQLDRYVVSKGDILFARMGTVGRCCVAPAEAEGWLFNYHIIRVALDKSRVDPRYIHWTIRASSDVEKYLSDKIRGATRKGVNSSIVGSLPCRVPPIPEQRRIVAYLDRLQAKVDEMKRLREEARAELDALLPAILDKAFKGEL